MLHPDQISAIQVKVDGQWVEADFGALEPGDVFRLVDSDGTPVSDSCGRTEFRVTSHPSVECEGNDSCTPFHTVSISYSPPSA